MKRIILPVALVGLLFQPVFASNHKGCSSSYSEPTVEKNISLNYEKTLDEPKANYSRSASMQMKVNLLKNYLDDMVLSDLEEFHAILISYEDKISMEHASYTIYKEIVAYTKGLIDDKPSQTIVDIALATEQVSILKDVVVSLDLVDTLNSDGPFTVFAPTNEAFVKLLADLDMTFDELASNTELLKTVVLYHVVPGNIMASDVVSLTEGTLVETVGGESLRVSNWNGVQVDMSNVIATDIEASNGVIHLVDEVLLPPSVRTSLGLATDRGTENIVNTAIQADNFPTLVAAIQAAGLVDTLSTDGPFTVYAPTEEAFTHLLHDLDMTAQELLADTELLTKVLTYHVVPGFYTADDILGLKAPMQSSTVQGSSLTINPHNGSPMVNESNIIATDVYASNGVIHVIDAVLLPTM